MGNFRTFEFRPYNKKKRKDSERIFHQVRAMILMFQFDFHFIFVKKNMQYYNFSSVKKS